MLQAFQRKMIFTCSVRRRNSRRKKIGFRFNSSNVKQRTHHPVLSFRIHFYREKVISTNYIEYSRLWEHPRRKTGRVSRHSPTTWHSNLAPAYPCPISSSPPTIILSTCFKKCSDLILPNASTALRFVHWMKLNAFLTYFIDFCVFFTNLMSYYKKYYV